MVSKELEGAHSNVMLTFCATMFSLDVREGVVGDGEDIVEYIH